MKEKDATYLNCVHCGKCLPVCPSYSIGLNEFFSPRGRVRLVLTDNADKLPLRASKVAESMSACLLCGRCVKICPNDVKIDELVIDEKIKLNELAGRAFSIDKIALKALKNKRKVLLKSALKIANIPFVEKLAGRYAPQPEGKSFIQNKDLIFIADIAGKNAGGKNIFTAGYFGGCVFNNIYPQISSDTVTSLTKNGIEVFVPKMQGCCGLPFISSGDVESFRELALNNARAFKDKNLDYIVTSCASCSYSINKLYPLYFDANDEGYAEVRQFSEKLLNIWSFFKELEKKGVKIKTGKLKKEIEAVFHIPCHLSNTEGFKPSSASENLIGEAGFIADKITGLKLKPLKYNYCCGNGGMFNITHYDLSREITKRKFEEIKEASPQEILTSCSGCIFSLKDQKGILKKNERLAVSHLINVYAESLKESKE
ncbi:MAG: (Fe-S)-binding protein [Deltaproteobacteria bacterium]|nr:(Fe-S)-binding protein [Deltaproteobacteria bacterium]